MKLRELDRSPRAWDITCLVISMLMLALNRLTPYICDDFTYDLNFLTGEPLDSIFEIIPSMYAHSFSMNGRLISHGLAQVFMLLSPGVFDVVNTAVFVGTLWLMHWLSGSESALLLACSFCLLWLLMPVFGQVVLWQVGAVNYFWSLTALLLFIAPELVRFLEGRVLLWRNWHRAAFCVYGFFFGWYNEIASFVGICMVPCLILLGRWLNKDKIRLHRLLPVLFAVLGYAVMLSMPAQASNKSGGLTAELLVRRFAVCSGMLVKYLLPLLIPLALILFFKFDSLPRKKLILSGLFALAGVCANYMPLAASYYPERCLCTPVLLLIMALLFPLSEFAKREYRMNFCLVCAVVICLTAPFILTGSADIVSCHRQHAQREQTIAAAVDAGERDVTANVVIPQTRWSGYWGVRDLTDDPDTWPNHDMARYYGLDSLIGE